ISARHELLKKGEKSHHNDNVTVIEKNANEINDKISSIFMKMRSKIVIMRVQRERLAVELNNLNMFFVHGLKEPAMKDPYFANRKELHDLSFKPRAELGPRAAFGLLRMRSNILLRLLSDGYNSDQIKDMLVDVFHKINKPGEHDQKRTKRLRELAQAVKWAKANKKQINSLKDVIARIHHIKDSKVNKS
ncbi:MAG: hypothetical protein AAF621_01095, partial [Pseudomonadota bacterium]